MAGHSKWANIQHRKGAQDKKRGKLFTKLGRDVTVAARAGGADLASNAALRLAVDKAGTTRFTDLLRAHVYVLSKAIAAQAAVDRVRL